MNISPPMVGVPALVLCHLGPTSRISWPAFSRRRAGRITLQPKSPVAAKLTTHAKIISMAVLPLARARQALSFCSAIYAATTSRSSKCRFSRPTIW